MRAMQRKYDRTEKARAKRDARTARKAAKRNGMPHRPGDPSSRVLDAPQAQQSASSRQSEGADA
jgi:hypothetical protein